LEPYSEGKQQKAVPISISAKQQEEFQVLEAKWQSELIALKESQKQEYRDFVVADYLQKADEAKKALQFHPPVINDSQSRRPEKLLMPTRDDGDLGLPASPRERSPRSPRPLDDAQGDTPPPQPHANPEFAMKLAELTNMGFDERSAECALNIANWNVVSLGTITLAYFGCWNAQMYILCL